MANTRLELLMKKDEVSYVQGSPLLLEAYALHKDTVTGDCIAQLKWKNLDSRTVKAVMVELHTYDAFNSKLAPIQYQYDGLNAASGSEFGGKTPIVIHDSNVSRFDVALKAVSFTDGSIWQNDADRIFEPLPKTQAQTLSPELREQLERDLKQQRKAAQYTMQTAGDLWQCGCGSWQKNGMSCLKCKITESDLAAACDPTTLQAHLDAYKGEQERKRIEAERKAEEERIEREKQLAEDARQRVIKKKKTRKICAVAGIALALVIAIGCAVKFWIVPQSKYNAAIKLRNAGQYDEAVTAFERMGDYKDAAAQIPATYYAKGEALRTSGEYDSAVTAFTSAGDYNDAAAQIPVTYYAKGEALRASGEYDAAVTAFTNAGNYNDAATQIKATYYAEGSALLNGGNREEAIAAFTKAADFSDAETRIEEIYGMYYADGEALRDAKDWDDAIEAFPNAGEYSDAPTQITETRYQEAMSLYESGDYGSAYSTLTSIKGYKDVDNLLATDDNLIAAAAAAARDAKFAVGNYVEFGTYPQTSSGDDATAIEWLVVARDGNNALLLSRYGLDAQPYNEESGRTTWEKCTLRTWLNDSFINKAFTEEEQSAILMTKVDNSQSQCYSGYDTDGGNDTQDRVFLLSYAEANEYLGVTYDDSDNKTSRVSPTDYAEAQGAYTNEYYETADGEYAWWWWLRSPGLYKVDAAYVSVIGSLDYARVYLDYGCVRSALWVNIESGVF